MEEDGQHLKNAPWTGFHADWSSEENNENKMWIQCEDIYSVFLLVIKVQNNYALIIVWLWPDFTLRKLRIWKERECEEKGNKSFPLLSLTLAFI